MTGAAPAEARTPDEIVKQFGYLLNAMDFAAQADNPSELGYAAKRQAVLDFVRQLATPAEAGQERCIYWVAGEYENGMDDLDELVRQQMDDRGERHGVIEIAPARYLPHFWVSVRPDPKDPDCDAWTRHETLAEAEAAAEQALIPDGVHGHG